MGLFDKIRGEFIDIIEWTEPARNEVLAYRFPRYQNEIKMNAKLTVREGQAAVFVNEGQIADVFAPGMYTLATNNMPILSTLKGWKYGFNSPFKAEVYFINTRRWTDQKWGTANPAMVRDPEFGPVRVRAFGTYALQVSDPATFLRQLVSTDPSFEVFEISAQVRNTIVPRITQAIATSGIPIMELAGGSDKLSALALEKIAPDLKAIGLSLTNLYVENISMPPEVEAALDKRSSMAVIGDMGKFTHFQTATAIGDAAKNPGGIAGIGAGLGAGVTMANAMSGALAGSVAPAAAAPPPLPPSVSFFAAINGAQAGPFDMNTLAGKIREGAVTRATLVWRAGMANWSAAESVPELGSFFAAAPPPLPPRL